MIDFNKYFDYTLIPKDFDGTIIMSLKTDKNGDPLLNMDEVYQSFQLMKQAFQNNEIVCMLDAIQIKEG